jgi:hypothetical protein
VLPNSERCLIWDALARASGNKLEAAASVADWTECSAVQDEEKCSGLPSVTDSHGGYLVEVRESR